ncbi:glycerate kinase subfamily protein [Peptoniphilus sp. ING2-D1G]|nr:glycerate kinase subfamily protein [Peptoniphilus sp. ING2-D1G]
MKKCNIVIASDSYKGSLSSLEVANYIESGILKTGYEFDIKKFPIADGGEGTVSSITNALRGEIKKFKVYDVFMRYTEAELGLLDDNVAILETASPLGLNKLDKNNLNPMVASSFGLGQMILNAINSGSKEIYIGLGGSAVNDGGVGLAKSLGAEFLDKDGNEIKDGIIGLKDLKEIKIDNLDNRLKKIKICLLSDVTNPLCGSEGATYIYGPQKGIKKEELKEIDSWMHNYGNLLEKLFDKEIIDYPGSGAAGGIGASLMAFANAQMYRGIDKILEMIKIEESIKNSDIVFTGEGKIDGQSKFGKAPIGVAKLAKKYKVPVVAIVGSSDRSSVELLDSGIDLILDIINEPMTLDYAIEHSEELIEMQAYMAIKHYISSSKYYK